jgi:hypothetical protein
MLKRSHSSGLGTLLVVGLVAAATGCARSDGVLGANTGRVQFHLSSGATSVAGAGSAVLGAATNGDRGEGPSRFFQSASVTFASVLARNLSGELVNVTMDLPVTVDVVSMEMGKQVVLPDGELPPGTYDQVVIVMTHVTAVTHDGTTITITPAGGGWTSVIPMCQFSVEEGGSATVSLTFMLKQAFSWGGNGYHFQPALACGDSST